MGAVAVGGLGGLTFLLDQTRDLLPRHVLAFAGLVLLACFLAVRVGSYHEVDEFLGFDLFGMRIAWVLELAGIIAVGGCAVMNCLWYKRGAMVAAD